MRVSARRVPSNARLIDACRSGNMSAWAEIVDRHERLVYAIPRREGLDADDAADVTQETFAALLESLDTISDPDSLGSWLMTVARRKAWRRRLIRQRQLAGDDVDRLPSGDDAAESTVEALWLHDAVQRLDEPCRSLVLALFFDPDEPSYAEIASQLGRPIGSVGPLRGRCIERLKSELERGAR